MALLRGGKRGPVHLGHVGRDELKTLGPLLILERANFGKKRALGKGYGSPRSTPLWKSELEQELPELWGLHPPKGHPLFGPVR